MLLQSPKTHVTVLVTHRGRNWPPRSAIIKNKKFLGFAIGLVSLPLDRAMTSFYRVPYSFSLISQQPFGILI